MFGVFMDLKLPCILLVAYFLGNISPGWWLVRIFGKGDVREQGSGGTGATNTARALGKYWFYAVLGLDMLKAAIAVWLPFVFYGTEAPLAYHVAAGITVIGGHIWPLLLGFRGGKGIGPFLGTWVAMGIIYWPIPFTLLGPIFGGLFFLPLKKGAFMSALCALMVQPLALWLLTRDDSAAVLAALGAAFVLLAHRTNFKTAFGTNNRNK
jgi:glycerol-3-phosphate acyltransferase PlsY